MSLDSATRYQLLTSFSREEEEALDIIIALAEILSPLEDDSIDGLTHVFIELFDALVAQQRSRPQASGFDKTLLHLWVSQRYQDKHVGAGRLAKFH